MRLTSFPNCCTAKVLYDFGETSLSGGTWEIPESVEDVKRKLISKIKYAKSNGYAVLVATTNDEQPITNRALQEVGFIQSDWMKKQNHSRSRLCLWYYPVEEYQPSEETSNA